MLSIVQSKLDKLHPTSFSRDLFYPSLHIHQGRIHQCSLTFFSEGGGGSDGFQWAHYKHYTPGTEIKGFQRVSLDILGFPGTSSVFFFLNQKETLLTYLLFNHEQFQRLTAGCNLNTDQYLHSPHVCAVPRVADPDPFFKKGLIQSSKVFFKISVIIFNLK